MASEEFGSVPHTSAAWWLPHPATFCEQDTVPALRELPVQREKHAQNQSQKELRHKAPMCTREGYLAQLGVSGKFPVKVKSRLRLEGCKNIQGHNQKTFWW